MIKDWLRTEIKEKKKVSLGLFLVGILVVKRGGEKKHKRKKRERPILKKKKLGLLVFFFFLLVIVFEERGSILFAFRVFERDKKGVKLFFRQKGKREERV